jgi:hypothetical protein
MWKPYPNYEGIFEQNEQGEVRRVALDLEAIAPLQSFPMYLRNKYNYNGESKHFIFNLKKDYLLQRIDACDTCDVNVLHNMRIYVESAQFTDEEVIDWMMKFAWNLSFAQIAEYFTVKLEEGDLRDKFYSVRSDKETVLS